MDFKGPVGVKARPSTARPCQCGPSARVHAQASGQVAGVPSARHPQRGDRGLIVRQGYGDPEDDKARARWGRYRDILDMYAPRRPWAHAPASPKRRQAVTTGLRELRRHGHHQVTSEGTLRSTSRSSSTWASSSGCVLNPSVVKSPVENNMAHSITATAMRPGVHSKQPAASNRARHTTAALRDHHHMRLHVPDHRTPVSPAALPHAANASLREQHGT